jgi:hypothetical protein
LVDLKTVPEQLERIVLGFDRRSSSAPAGGERLDTETGRKSADTVGMLNLQLSGVTG